MISVDVALILADFAVISADFAVISADVGLILADFDRSRDASDTLRSRNSTGGGTLTPGARKTIASWAHSEPRAKSSA